MNSQFLFDDVPASAPASTQAAPAAPRQPASSGDLRGIVDYVIFHSTESGYTVLSVTVGEGRKQEEVKCTGSCVEKPTEGLEYEFTGEWTNHPKYGRQFAFKAINHVRPSDSAGIERYLAGGLVKGIGPSVAAKIVKMFGERTLEVLDQCDERLLQQVPGIGAAKSAAIVEQWAEKEKYREQTIALLAMGISNWLCVKIIKHFEAMGTDPLKGVMNDPYCLTEIWGVGFKTADNIGKKAGIGSRDPRRIRAAVVYVLQQARDGEGHCYLTEPQVVERVNADEVCGLEDYDDTVREYLRGADGDLRLMQNVTLEAKSGLLPTFWLAGLHHEETRLATRLKELAETPAANRPYLREDALQAAFEEEMGFRLTEQQTEAVYALLSRRMAVLTGGPGTGKTQITNAIVKLAEQAGLSVGLASPTGKAAKRLEEMTGHEAKTLHRLLEYSQKARAFGRNADNPLDYDLVIVDEASMVDVNLAYSLLEAVDRRHTQLLLVGDKDQLPSVGPGNILRDVIASGVAEVRELTQIMRQAEGSGIITDAHLINHGKMPMLASADSTFIEAEDSDLARDYILSLAKSAARDGKECQILSPMHRGPLGTGALNAMLQFALNPPSPMRPQLVLGRDPKTQRTFRLGDRVLQTKNDYDRECMNGEQGYVSGVDKENGEVTITFPHTSAVYGKKDLSNVELAYCISVHKAQGGEFSHVVFIASMSHYRMLHRPVFYTALTRAREKIFVVGDLSAVQRYVSNNKITRRNTRLVERICSQ